MTLRLSALQSLRERIGGLLGRCALVAEIVEALGLVASGYCC